MADKDAKTGKVKYRVLKTCFVNDTLHDPGKRKDYFIMAAPGLEGSALELVNVSPAKAAAAAQGPQK